MKRILKSKKVHLALAGAIAAVISVFIDGDYTEELLTLITFLTTALVGGQAAIDMNHGSPSDKVDS